MLPADSGSPSWEWQALQVLNTSLVAVFESRGRAEYAEAVLFGADVLSGIGGGIAMALFVSRFDEL